MDLSACLSRIAHLWIFVCVCLLQSPLRTRWLMDPRSSCWWLGLRTTWPVWPAGPSLRPTSSGPRMGSLWRGPTSPRWLTHIHETQHIYKSCKKKKKSRLSCFKRICTTNCNLLLSNSHDESVCCLFICFLPWALRRGNTVCTPQAAQHPWSPAPGKYSMQHTQCGRHSQHKTSSVLG